MNKQGRKLIADSLCDIPCLPGVYKMISQGHEILYVGKAKNLKNRVAHYASEDMGSARLNLMVAQVCFLDYITVASEEEALILEANLIREYKPKYNILFKDDKSFPYIKIDANHDFPHLAKYRGKPLSGQKLYGPFSSVASLNTMFGTLQKVFQLRNCTNQYFASRKRPCIQYEIKRCSAPCVEYISKQEYAKIVKQTQMFLEGKTSVLQTVLAKDMQFLSDNFHYEQAAVVRDRIRAINLIQQQSNNAFIVGDSDVIGVANSHNIYCLTVFSYRGGQNYGSKTYFPSNTQETSPEEVILNFITVFYQSRVPPSKVLIPFPIKDTQVLEKALLKMHKVPSKIFVEEQNEIVISANRNALTFLEQKFDKNRQNKEIFLKIAQLFGVKNEIRKIEVYDNSHIFGQYAVGAIIAADVDGIIKSECRAYTLEGLIPKMHGGDDYEMLRQSLHRRFKSKNIKQNPELIIRDGGKGHFNTAKEVLDCYAIDATLVSMAKGEDRNSGRETFFMSEKEPFTLPHSDKVMHYLQRLRDEVHNLAISTYRKKHQKAMYRSTLESAPGIGKAKKQLLLNHFGSVEGAVKASVQELERIKGIGGRMATKLHKALQNLI
jgi:excinuclease ABC subunit C